MIVSVCIYLVIALPVLIAFYVPARLVESLTLRLFRRRCAGRLYLVCSRRHNWHEFLTNNLIPALPNYIEVIWHLRERSLKYPVLLKRLASSRIYGVPRPYLVLVTRRALLCRSLNGPLQQIKPHAKKSTVTRQACSKLIAEAERKLRAPSGPHARKRANTAPSHQSTQRSS